MPNYYKEGCSVNTNGVSPQAREALASMEVALDSVNPDWRSEYCAKGSSQYEIFVKSGSGEIRYKNVPFGFGK